MDGKWIKKPVADSAVIFVHGILSSGETCWLSENGSYWPQMLAAPESGASAGVYVFSYNTSLLSGSYSISDAAKSLHEHLDIDGLLKLKSLVFVCHSMGGLVVRRLLVQREYQYSQLNLGLFLVASPSMGSEYASWLVPIFRVVGHVQAEALRLSQSNVWLNDLDEDFSNLLKRRRIVGRELVEDEPFVKIGVLSRTQIVPPISAVRYFDEPLKIPKSNHFSIAKPADTDALQYRVLLKFLAGLPDGAGTSVGNIQANGSNESVPEQTEIPSVVVRSLQLASEAEKSKFLKSVPKGPGIELSTLPPAIIDGFEQAVSAQEARTIVSQASRLVLLAEPEFQGNPRLVAVLANMLPAGDPSVSTLVRAAFTLAALKGPRMLVALVISAPPAAYEGAHDAVMELFRRLGVKRS